MSVTPLTQFIRASDNVVKFVVGFKLIRAENHTVFNLEVRNTELQELWKKAKDNYDNYLDHLISLEGINSEDISSADAKYQSTYETFVDCMSEINEKLQQLKSVKSPNSTTAAMVVSTPQNSPSHHSSNLSNLSNTASSDVQHTSNISISNWSLPPTASNTMHNLNLPPCEIDDFHGDFLSWPTFRDLFTAMFINNSRLSDIERLCHLVQKTKSCQIFRSLIEVSRWLGSH